MASAPEASSSAAFVPATSTDISDALAASIPAEASPNSPNPGAKPSRPVKATRDPPAFQSTDGDDEAAAAQFAAPEHEGAAHDAQDTAVDQQEGLQPEASEAATTSDVSKSVNTPLAGASTTADSAAPSSADHSSTAKTASPDATPTKAAPAPVPVSSTRETKATSAPSANNQRPKSIKKKGGLSGFFLACLPCISSNAHDDTPPNARTSAPTASTSTSAPAPTPASANKEKSSVDNEKAGTHESTATTLAANTAAETPNEKEVPVVVAPPSPASGVILSQEETEGVTSGAVMAPGKEVLPVAPGKTRRRRSGKSPVNDQSIITSVPEPGMPQVQRMQESDEDDDSGSEEDEEEEDEEQSLIARGGVGIPIGEDGLPHPLLDELAPELKGRKCLVLDLDETLVHSSFKMVHAADYVVPVEIENQYHNVYVIKRPGVDAFLKAMGEIYEVVIFTASLSKYADPVLDQLDIHRVVKHRLFRESCYNNKGNYVKDLSQLGRPMSECIIIDNSPASYVFHVNNAVPISSWFNDPHDTELTDLVPFLTDLERVDDVRSVLDAGLYQHQQQADDWPLDKKVQAMEFA